MTNEEYVEEILINAHQQGVYNDVLDEVGKLMRQNRTITFYDAIQEVFHELITKGKMSY